MAKIVRDCTFKIVDTDNGTSNEKTIRDVDDSSEAYKKLRDEYRKKKNLSRTEFEKRFNIESKKTKVRFADKPWSDGDELKKSLENLPSVDSISYVPPLRGAYGPPAFLVNANDDFDTVKKQVNNYYDGLIVERYNGTTMKIVISATEADKSN